MSNTTSKKTKEKHQVQVIRPKRSDEGDHVYFQLRVNTSKLRAGAPQPQFPPQYVPTKRKLWAFEDSFSTVSPPQVALVAVYHVETRQNEP